MEWRWLNEHRLTSALDRIEDDDELNDLLDALDLILEDPTRPDLTAPMQGTQDHADRQIALLPHGWVLVYTIHPSGVPVSAMFPALVVRLFDKRFDL